MIFDFLETPLRVGGTFQSQLSEIFPLLLLFVFFRSVLKFPYDDVSCQIVSWITKLSDVKGIQQANFYVKKKVK